MSAFRVIAAAASVCLAPGAALATEAAMGRYIPGAYVTPTAGALPPPGVYWNAATLYYKGDISAELQIPVAGTTTLGLKAVLVGETFTGLWVPDLELGNDLGFSMSLSLPLTYIEATAQLGGLSVTQEDTALGDIMFAPTLGWHSGENFVSGSLRVFAPNGPYEVGALDNIGMNYWSFSPTLSYTRIDAERKLDFSVVGGIDINTRNPDTDYYSGAMAHVDASLIHSFTEHFSAGVFGAVLYQFQDDDGGMAEQLDGFKGRSFSIGPVLKYTAGTKEKPLIASLTWAPEFGGKNRTQGNGVYLSITGKF